MKILAITAALFCAACQNLTPEERAIIDHSITKFQDSADRLIDAKLDQVAPRPAPAKTGLAK